MADISVLNVRGGVVDSMTTSGIVASGAEGTIPCNKGKDARMAVWVKNGDVGDIKFIIKAPVSGGGVRTSLGDLSVTITAGDEALIPLFDTARFKTLSGNTIGYALTDTVDGVLEAGELANVTIVAVQL